MTKKKILVDFLTLCGKGKSREAFKKYAGNNFKHHNVNFKGDAETLIAAMEENARVMPDKIFEIRRILEDGDFVASHAHLRRNKDDLGFAIMHILRFENGKIVEMWDFGQQVPEDMPNEHGMF